MAIRLLSDGTFEFDTVAEAVEFQKMARAQNGAPKTPRATPRTRIAARNEESIPPLPSIDDFMAGLRATQERLVRALVDTDGEVTTEQLGELAGIKGGAVGPLLRHVRDGAARCGIARDFIRTRKVPRGPGGKQISYYVLNPEIKRQILAGAKQQ